jgi:predicted transcriptional regulator
MGRILVARESNEAGALMTVRELVAALNLEVLTGDVNLGERIEAGYVSDLLSDVIANAPENSIWVTVQRHINILGVAKLRNIAAIIIPRKLKVESDVVEKAKAEEVALLRTGHSAFEITGRLHALMKEG